MWPKTNLKPVPDNLSALFKTLDILIGGTNISLQETTVSTRRVMPVPLKETKSQNPYSHSLQFRKI